MDELTAQITQEIYRAMEALGAQSDLLCIVGSWGDSLPPELVLSELRAWNGEATKRTEPA